MREGFTADDQTPLPNFVPLAIADFFRALGIRGNEHVNLTDQFLRIKTAVICAVCSKPLLR